jgi:hypothetical protein
VGVGRGDIHGFVLWLYLRPKGGNSVGFVRGGYLISDLLGECAYSAVFFGTQSYFGHRNGGETTPEVTLRLVPRPGKRALGWHRTHITPPISANSNYISLVKGPAGGCEGARSGRL